MPHLGDLECRATYRSVVRTPATVLGQLAPDQLWEQLLLTSGGCEDKMPRAGRLKDEEALPELRKLLEEQSDQK